MDGYKYGNIEQRSAGVIAINYNISWVKELIKEWRDLALIKNVFVQIVLIEVIIDKINQFYQFCFINIYNFKDIRHNLNLSIHNNLFNI